MRRLLIALYIAIPMFTKAQVWVYYYPAIIVETEVLGKLLRSSVYDVVVVQDEKEYSSYVLADYNTFPGNQRSLMTDCNHSTTFSFEGKVKVIITRKDKMPLEECKVYPLVKEYDYQIENDQVILSLDAPAKCYVEIAGLEKHPLFLFADPPELNPPASTDADVEIIKTGISGAELKKILTESPKEIFYFEPGIHEYGDQTDQSYPGYQLPIISEKHYYFPGGTVFIGSFRGWDVTNTKFTGRGIITACGKERLAQSQSIPYNLIMFEGEGKNQLVEGLTFTNPSHFILLSRGEWTVRNTKMFGWWHQTDGWGGGDNSLIEDSFLKVNDDYIKMYNSNQVARNLLVYKQINGAIIQLGWNQGAHGRNGFAENIYIVKDADKVPGDISNTAVINLRNNDGNDISNFHIRNLYLEGNIQRILGIEMQGGRMDNFLIENVYLSGKNNKFNYLLARKGSTINNMVFKNWRFNGSLVDSDDAAILKKEGNVTNILYE